MKARLLVALSFIVLAICTMDDVAFSQDEVTESLTVGFYGTFKVLQLGPEVRYVTWEVFGTVASDTGQGLFNGTTVRCLGASLYGKESWDSDVSCIYTMKDGEKVFSSGKMGGKVGTPPSPAKGASKIIGGTGKYAGIQGRNEFISYALRPPSEGVSQNINKSKITYKLP
jgi:hypothetical protein